MTEHHNHRARLRLVLHARRARYVADPEALLILSDDEHHEANFPKVRVVLREMGEEDPWRRPYEIQFQRHLVTNPLDGATGAMDTCRPWSPAYAGRIELSMDGRIVWLGNRTFRRRAEDELAIQLARKIGRRIDDHNLHLVSRDECVQVVLALEMLGLSVRATYQRDQGGALVDLVQVEGRWANQRAIDAARAAAETAAPAPAGEPTDGPR